MTVRGILLGLGLAATIAACATTSGRRVSGEDLQKIRKGESTYGDVIAVLGEPEARKTTGEGEVLVYAYSEARADVTSYVPYLGSLFGKTKTENQVVYIFLDQNQVVREVQTEQGTSESGSSL